MPAFVPVVAGVVEHQRCLDLRYVIGTGLASVKGDACVKIAAETNGQLIDNPASETEADRA